MLLSDVQKYCHVTWERSGPFAWKPRSDVLWKFGFHVHVNLKDQRKGLKDCCQEVGLGNPENSSSFDFCTIDT